MSFASGLAVGTGFGINFGLLIGMASGQQRAVNRVRKHFISHELTIHDSCGKEISPEIVLEEAVPAKERFLLWFGVAICVTLLAGFGVLAAILFLVGAS